MPDITIALTDDEVRVSPATVVAIRARYAIARLGGAA